MKRVAVAAAVAMLALPASALGATFDARVVRSDALNLVLRRADGRTVTYASSRIAASSTDTARGGGANPPLAHIAGDPRSAASRAGALDPGVVVRVTPTSNGTIRLGLPPGIGATHQVTGVVGAASGGSLLLDLAHGLELRLRGAVGGLRACQQAQVVYHQEKFTLVADRATATGRSDCAA
jgi:hypothetical protein